MRRQFQNLLKSMRRLGRAENGVAIVEFALIVPIMLATYIGCTEAATLLTIDRKVQSVAGAIGDLVARTNKSMTKTQMEDYFRAATSIMTPYQSTGLVQTVTAVNVGKDGKAVIAWSVRYSGGTYSATVPEYKVGQKFDLPAEMIAIASGQTVIAAEADFSYQPAIGMVFNSAVPLHRSGLFMPRFGGTIEIQ
ncbi:TadE/TadG family type IV pilus assembly protein [Devosia soli]|uniref:TadE/TadG family type IV pilus assembly protein n=1 Tax=Devosia soli TaxID=361041 RepID=UPI00069B9874|nr:TadE/TadG family type IV pilus assembly protein [Devosia soli]